MQQNREIEALLQLVDDPDKEVFSTVEARLLTYGKPVVANLEDLWENTISEEVQERIEMIIHRIHFQALKQEFVLWKSGDSDLLHGSLLVAKYQYPELQSITTLQEIERMRRNLWLEMNNYITPIEQVKIVESILYNYYKMLGGEINYSQTEDFMIHKVIERKKGNALTNGILYVILAELLDIPVRAIRIPRQFVLGYFSHEALYDNGYEAGHPAEHIKFFVDPNSGTAFSHKDINQYFKRISVVPTTSYFKPRTNLQIIQTLLEEFAQCFDQAETLYKKEELLELKALLND